uniref:Uncharacterized protein n=1 Tax=Molossus molossus TaxID=27622 RepID=A0A7J8GKI5_MOLMO|nr:hypothetical protein HJG59_011529 [Molossus molossus]
MAKAVGHTGQAGTKLCAPRRPQTSAGRAPREANVAAGRGAARRAFSAQRTGPRDARHDWQRQQGCRAKPRGIRASQREGSWCPQKPQRSIGCYPRMIGSHANKRRPTGEKSKCCLSRACCSQESAIVACVLAEIQREEKWESLRRRKGGFVCALIQAVGMRGEAG